MRRNSFVLWLIGLAVLLTTTIVWAHDCSSPGDCLQTAGYNAVMAVVGGVLGVLAGLYANQITAAITSRQPPPPDLDDSKPVGSVVVENVYPMEGATVPVRPVGPPVTVKVYPLDTSLQPEDRIDVKLAGLLKDETDIVDFVTQTSDEAERFSKLATGPLNFHELGRTEQGPFNIVGEVAEAYKQYNESTAVTPLGKGIDMAGAVGADVLFDIAAPVTNFIDALAGGLGFEDWTIGNILSTSSRAIVTLGEGVVTAVRDSSLENVDPTGIHTFQKRSVNGAYGPIFKATSEAGEYWTEHGIGGGLADTWKALKSLTS